MKLINLQQAAISTVLLAPAVVFANTDPFTTAIADSTTKVGTYAAALVGLAAVAVGFMIAIKYVKKIVRAS